MICDFALNGMLRVTEGYLRHQGDKLLPVVKIGGAIRHKLSDVQALIAGKPEAREEPVE